jgi:hypothetical protein
LVLLLAHQPQPIAGIGVAKASRALPPLCSKAHRALLSTSHPLATRRWHGSADQRPKGPTALPLAASSAWRWGNRAGLPDV